ncbi:hypothetical protein Pfo_003250 [Paulownia fortunei]|nr:hypothetical protein Pfo_003250 [Paulownia fortunei]
MMHKRKPEWNEERLSDGEVMENHYASIPKVNDEHLESDDEKSEANSFDSERVNVDSLDSPPRSPWKQVEDHEDEEEEEDDALDSGSDGAESSSPDASMADIMPMLDELHPLLDEEAAQPVQMSRDGSDAASEQSSRSSTSSHESVDEIENHEDFEVADDDNEDGEDDEDAQGDKEEQTKSAITWTEEDQKNLMDLGSSEIERNQRLENLILRRRTQKNMSMVPEMNLIDLESSDLPFHVAPISTTRQNPFDLPHDSYDNSGLPPIPGSAPSILLTRRNPFDIPCDSSQEKPNLMGDGFQEELTTLQSREPFFRRHESFNVGPSVFAPNRQERLDVKLRPYFVPERMVSEESSYSPFHRQSSELSDSKVSSVPETESVGSVEDLEGQKLAEEDSPQELEVISMMEEVIEEFPSGDQELVSKREFSEEDVPREPQLISEMKHVSEHIGHGSQSSGEEESLELGLVEKRDVDFDDLKFQSQDVECHYEEGSVARPLGVQATGYNSCSEAVEQRYSSGSSSSSLSEVSERVFTEIEMLDGRRDGVAEEPDISTQTSVESTDLSITSTLVDDVPHKEPVYDSSPPAVRKNFSSSSISSDVHAESNLGLPPVLVKRTVSFIERESESQGIEHESARVDINVLEHENTNSGFSGADQRSESQGASAAPGVLCHESVRSKSCAEASVVENRVDQHTQGQVPSSSSDFNIQALVKSSDDKSLGHSEEEKHLLVDKGETVTSPNSDADYHEANEKLISTPSAGGSTYPFYDIAMHEPNFEHLDEVQVPNTPVDSFEKVRTIQNLNIPEVYELDHDISPNINAPFSPDFISMPSSASEEASSHVDTQTILEEADEIKEIDEGLLSELDSVGDFSITQWVSGSKEFEKHIDSVGESLSSAHRAETSTTKVVEINSVEVNKMEHAMHSGNSRDEIDIYEEELECISELQTSQTSTGENIDTSNREFNDRDGQDSTDHITSEEDIVSKEYEAKPANSVLNHNKEDNISGIPEVDMQSIEAVDSFTRKTELTSVETEVVVASAEVSHLDQVDIDTASGMPDLEARKLEDIDVVFKQFGDKEIEKPVVLEPPQAELVIGETIAEHSEHAEVSHLDQVDIDSASGMPELEARKLEDIDVVFKQFSDKEIEKPVVLEPPQAELVIGETIAEHSEHGTLHINTSVMNSTHETPILEVRSIEDATLDYNQVNDGSIGIHRLPDSVDDILHVVDSTKTQGTSELHVAETIPSEGTSLPPKKLLDGNSEKELKPNTDDGSVEVKAEKLDSPVGKEPSVREDSSIAAEKPDHEVNAPEDLHSITSVKGKGNISESSSSHSSSSSESSSSDSDRE